MTDKEKRMIEEIDDYLFEKYCIEGDTKIEEIIRFFQMTAAIVAVENGIKKDMTMELENIKKAKQWIPVSERMPEEHDIMISKDVKRLDLRNSWMYEKCSDEVEITIEIFEGKRIVSVSKTYDGKWIHPIVSYLCGKVIAWRELPEPYQGE